MKGRSSRVGARKVWDVQFDVLPHAENVIENIARSKLSVSAPEEEENPEQDEHQSQSNEMGKIKSAANEKKKKSPMFACQDGIIQILESMY